MLLVKVIFFRAKFKLTEVFDLDGATPGLAGAISMGCCLFA